MGVFLSTLDASVLVSGDDLTTVREVGSINVNTKKWTEYTVTFTAITEEKHIMFKNMGTTTNQPVYLDKVSVASEGGSCALKGCTPQSNNLVAHGGFEGGGAYGGWGSIQRDMDSRLVDAGSSGNAFIEETVNPMSYAHSPLYGNTHWMVLHTKQRPGLCFWCNNFDEGNSAVTIPLLKPTVPGLSYRLSFFGATKNPLTSKRAHINVNIADDPYCTAPNCSSDTIDWQESIQGDQSLMNDFEFNGEKNKWILYHRDFVATGAMTHILLQAQDGVEPALDDICITREPFLEQLRPAKLYYNTYNSVRHMSEDAVETTVKSDNGFDLFGLDLVGDALLLSDNGVGVRSVEGLFTTTDANEVTTRVSRSLATDLVRDGSNAYLAANYGVHKIAGFAATGQNTTSQMNTINAVATPFSLAVSDGYLFVAGASQLSLTNLSNGQTKLVNGHGVNMFGFLDMGDDGQLYAADPASDAVRVITSAQIATLKSGLNNNATLNIGPLSVLSQGGLLADQMNGSAGHDIRGPIGVDHKGDTVWVTIDTGAGQDGRIISIDATSGAQVLFADDIPGPRDLVVVQ